jgi:hypothetical protein
LAVVFPSVAFVMVRWKKLTAYSLGTSSIAGGINRQTGGGFARGGILEQRAFNRFTELQTI